MPDKEDKHMLSILVPTYNRAHLIEETVTHALASMADGDELIIRDNASTDGSPALLEAMVRRDPRIRLELATHNAGPVGNWRECLRLARGEHVKLLFSDDLIFPDAFRRFYAAYLAGNYRAGFTAAMIGTKVDDALPEFVVPDVGERLPFAVFSRLTLTHLGKVPVSPSAFIFETALFTRCFDEAMDMLKDKPDAMSTGAGIDLLIVTLAVQYAGSACYMREPHVFFRQHGGSISTEKSRQVKQLYNLARARFAARTSGSFYAAVLSAGYAWSDFVCRLRKAVRDRADRTVAQSFGNLPVRELQLYLEDAPVVESSSATGLSKALVPMLRELAPRTGQTFVVQTHRLLDESQVLRLGRHAPRIAGMLDNLIARATARLPFRLAAACARLHGAWLGLQFRYAVGDRSATVLWSAIGIDPLSLVRVDACASAMGLPFEAYLVDDVEMHPENVSKTCLPGILRRTLRRAARVYTITPELGARCAQRYGIAVSDLPLTADCPITPASNAGAPTHFAAYLGSVNHLYEDGLRLLIDIMSELRANTGRDLSLRVISPLDDVARMLDVAVPDWIVCGVERQQTRLTATLADSEFCYLPYSHAESARLMTGSSFPSKLLDYLAWARQIVVYAPGDSVPYNFFRRESLDFFTDSEKALRLHLAAIAHATRDNSARYRAALMRHHGPGRATATIFGGRDTDPDALH